MGGIPEGRRSVFSVTGRPVNPKQSYYCRDDDDGPHHRLFHGVVNNRNNPLCDTPTQEKVRTQMEEKSYFDRTNGCTTGLSRRWDQRGCDSCIQTGQCDQNNIGHQRTTPSGCGHSSWTIHQIWMWQGRMWNVRSTVRSVVV